MSHSGFRGGNPPYPPYEFDETCGNGSALPRPACGERVESRRLLEQFTADQHAADFAGAGADLVEFGVAQQPPGRVIVDIAVAAKQLDAVEPAFLGFLPRPAHAPS